MLESRYSFLLILLTVELNLGRVDLNSTSFKGCLLPCKFFAVICILYDILALCGLFLTIIQNII